jgi:gliding motility-associated-like protein
LFNLLPIINLVKTNTTDTVTFHVSENDALSNTNPISNLENYEPPATPFTIFIRIDNGNCHSITSFQLFTKNCPPVIYNYVTANNDGSNDFFYIAGLRNIFLNFNLQIYNRWGNLVWEGNQNTNDWRGETTANNVISGSNVPDGTYYYILNLNDIDYPDPFVGYVYFTK